MHLKINEDVTSSKNSQDSKDFGGHFGTVRSIC